MSTRRMINMVLKNLRDQNGKTPKRPNKLETPSAVEQQNLRVIKGILVRGCKGVVEDNATIPFYLKLLSSKGQS